MTPERKNEIWAMLPEEEQIEFQKAYDTMYECESYDMGFKDALESVFGYYNLTAQAEEATQKSPSEPKFSIGQRVILTEQYCKIPKGTTGIVIRVQTEPYFSYVVASESGAFSYFSIVPKYLEAYPSDEKPKEPKFKVGDKVSLFGQVATIFKAHCNGYDVIFGNGATLYNLPEATLDPYIEPNGESDDKSKPSQANPLDVAKSVEPSTKENACLSNSFQSFTDWNKYRLDLAKEIAVAMIKCECDWDVSNCAVSYANEIVKRLKETEE